MVDGRNLGLVTQCFSWEKCFLRLLAQTGRTQPTPGKAASMDDLAAPCWKRDVP